MHYLSVNRYLVSKTSYLCKAGQHRSDLRINTLRKMKKILTLRLSPKEAYTEELYKKIVRRNAKVSPDDKISIRTTRRSIDARSKNVKINVQAEVYLNETPPSLITYKKEGKNVKNADPAVIVGFGPAGMFAALRLIELGIKPIIMERGKEVQLRRRDIADINKKQIVDQDSNYCFGEGGAGTFSDGKLYTRSKKRGDVRRVLEILVAHGATEDILIDAHPHIGTNKLPNIISEIRAHILAAGGEIMFETKVTDFIIEKGEMKGVITANGEKIKGLGVILATGHSARDIYKLLDAKKVEIEAKPFAVGVRVEHTQNLIDSIQYHCEVRGEYLPASSYSLVRQVKTRKVQRGVFSFCMCPGGFIVPASTAPGEIVLNGMSPSRRDSKFANSGIVVSVGLEDFKKYEKHGALAGMYYQQEIEQTAFKFGGGGQQAPAQRLVDFVENKTSTNLLETSYQPGLQSANMREVLPDPVSYALRNAFNYFGRKMNGYLTNEAQIVGVESRSSSPVRIPRDKETLEHVQIKGLFPCAEGAGYAGGIVSAAMDGEKCAEALVKVRV